MDLKKVYSRVDREALWSVLKIYGVGRHLLKGIQAFYREANACVRVGGEFSESFSLCLKELEGTGKLISEPEYPAWQQSTGVQSVCEIGVPVWG